VPLGGRYVPLHAADAVRLLHASLHDMGRRQAVDEALRVGDEYYGGAERHSAYRARGDVLSVLRLHLLDERVQDVDGRLKVKNRFLWHGPQLMMRYPPLSAARTTLPATGVGVKEFGLTGV